MLQSSIDRLINQVHGKAIHEQKSDEGGKVGRVVSATEARIHFGELMREAVETREPITIERDGTPHVVLLAIEEYQRLLQDQPPEDWQELVTTARALVSADLDGRPLPAPEEIIHQLREERDEYLLGMR
jgi:prevent-host-death family protein